MPDLLARAILRTTMSQIRYVAPVWPGSAAEPVQRVYRDVQRRWSCTHRYRTCWPRAG